MLTETGMDPLLIAIIAAVVLIRIGLHFYDKSRITKAAQGKGWQAVAVTWSPFAPGWFFEKGERHYRVWYSDEYGNRCGRYCKTSLFTGVFWRDSAA